MRICPSMHSAAIRFNRTRLGQIGNRCAIIVLCAAAIAVAPFEASAQNVVMPAAQPMGAMGADNGVAAMSSSGDVSFFSQDLGTLLRLRYSTESYGQDQGNFDVGTMQVITFDDAAIIADGQVTMNDQDGVGFNVGAGYRWMDFPMIAPEGRVEGIGLFADGQHTEAGNFFPQIGVSMESLGELWDLRGNVYVPLGPQTQVGNFKPTGVLGFQGNSLSQLTQAGVDTSFTVGELEIARRLGIERDAWAFAGPYFVANSDDSAAGYKVGVRGYAYPDLLLQFAVSNDDIFHTEATFSLQWFVGRTRTNFQPAGSVADRIREPFMRNDYVALNRTTQAGGTPLTQPDGEALRFVHVASNAAPGGNGTAEHPYNELNEANGTGSQNGDIILAHSTSTFNTNSILKDNQKLFGEGNNFNLTVDTQQRGVISIPETSPGSRALARPTINIAASTDAVTLANINEVANFDINGQNHANTRAIVAPAGGAGNPNLHDLTISNTAGAGNAGDAIFFKPSAFIDSNDSNGNGSTTDTIVPGNVTINNVTFNNIAGNGIHIDSSTPVDVTLPTVTLQEAIAISNVASNDGTQAGINIENTHSGTGHTTTLTGYNYNGGTTSLGGLRLNNFNGTFNGSNSTLIGGNSAGSGVQILGNTDSTGITFASTWAMTGIAGTDVDIDGNDQLGGTITFNNAINNTAGRSVSVQNVATGAVISFNGAITDSGTGILVNSNSGGEVAFVGPITSNISTAGATSVLLTDNTGANIDFAFATGNMTINNTNDANGFVATGGGTISMAGTTNAITTATGQDLKITGMTIAAGGFNVGDVNRNTAGATTNAIQLENNTATGSPAGAIVIGNTTDTTPGDAGTIQGGTLDAIRIKDSANVSISGLKIDNTSSPTVAGIHVEKSNTATMTTDLSNLEIDGGGVGIDTLGGGTGAVTMTINDTAINNSQLAGLRFTNLNAGTVTGNTVTLDGQNATTGADGIQINNSNATITFDSTSSIKNFSDNDFEVAQGKGVITYNGTIDNSTPGNGGSTTGHSVNVHGITGGSVTFGTTSTITDNNSGILVNGNSGGTVSVNGTTNTLSTGANDAVTITNNTGGTVNMGTLAITTTSGTGFNADTNTGATITTGPLTIATTSGKGFVAKNGGTLSVTGLTNTVSRTAGVTDAAVDIEGMTIGAVDFHSVNATGGVNGSRFVNNTGGTITIGDTGNTAGQGGTITGTTNAAVHAENSNVVLNGVTATNAGGAGTNSVEILHNNSTAMTAAVNNLTINNTTAASNGLDVDGTGGTGTFTFTSGGTNNITTTTGTGLNMANVSVGAAGANFQNVTVNGATNGIVMNNVSGPGTVTVGANGGAAGSGGSLTTTGDAIKITNAQSAAFQHVHILSAGGMGVNIDHSTTATTDMSLRFTDLDLDTATGTGFNVLGENNTRTLNIQLRGSNLTDNVVMNDTGSGVFNMVTDSTTVTSSGTDVAFALTFTGAGTQTGNATFSGTNNFTAGNASALLVSTAGASTKNVNLNVQDGTFTNTSTTSAAANFSAGGSTNFGATIQGNTFADNSVGGQDFLMTATGAPSHALLNLGGDTPADFNTAAGQGAFNLTQSGGASFRVFENVNTLAGTRNSGTVNETGTFTDSGAVTPTIPTPPTSP